MKMVMPLLAPVAGVIRFVAPEGAALSGGDLIARLELDDANAVVRAEPYTGGFPAESGPPVVLSNQVNGLGEGGREEAALCDPLACLN